MLVYWGGASYGLVRAKWYRKWERCPAAPHLVRVRTSPSRKKRARAPPDSADEDSEVEVDVEVRRGGPNA